jgi:hypothetical protein
MTREEYNQMELVPLYGTGLLDEDKNLQKILCNALFVWNEDGGCIEEINLVNINDILMVDINKKYEFYIKEIK